MAASDDLTGCRVLVVEDDGMLAMQLEDLLDEIGCMVAGSASRLEAAGRACEDTAFDVALLDVNLHGELSFPLADALLARGRPVIISTGYDETVLPDSLRALPVLRKPYRRGDLEVALWDALHSDPRSSTDAPHPSA